MGERWWFFVQATAKIESCFINRILGGLGPEVKMVARRSALEALEHVAAKMGGKGAVVSSLGGFMEGTFTPHLVADSFSDNKPQEFQDFSH